MCFSKKNQRESGRFPEERSYDVYKCNVSVYAGTGSSFGTGGGRCE